MKDPWNPLSLPSQRGRTVVVTGGNAGIGYFIVEQLAQAGARVVIASRSQQKARTAISAVKERVGATDLDFVALDLSSMESVREAAEQLNALDRIDVLINNAGITDAGKRREVTKDGHELVVGTNFLGHFALTALVFRSIQPEGRVVGLGSLSAASTKLEADDLYSERDYQPSRAYGFSKHAVHGFAFELDRRLRAVGDSRASLLAHPGWASDKFTPRVPGVNDNPSKVPNPLPMPQGKDKGAWPIVRAATDPDAESGTYFGPGGTGGLAGNPVRATPPESSAAPAFGGALWKDAEQRSGVTFAL
ncbi:SDR family NAD(P)-dependent oxidoreductase [Streptomyces sp. NPDC058373]|uniref:SDR family NAD(P)-dependent oxidoreductase n=1 Tax=Streptomyces sp. NPDC058373 TaxID=3346465 RepID=UPI003648FAD9